MIQAFAKTLLCASLAFVTAGPSKAHLLWSPPVQGGGGDSTVTTTTIPTVATTYNLQQVIDKAKQIDPTRGQAIQDAKDNNTIGFVEFHSPNNYGVHDYNTIALNPDYEALVMAVALLHEYVHLVNCAGPASGGGSGGDNRVTDPCFDCIHMQMTADSWTLLTQWFCELDNPGSAGAVSVICQVRKDLRTDAGKQWTKCNAHNCSGQPSLSALANWAAPCPNCP